MYDLRGAQLTFADIASINRQLRPVEFKVSIILHNYSSLSIELLHVDESVWEDA